MPPEITLIPFAEQHFSTLANWFSNEREVVQWGGSGVWFPLDPAQLRAMIEESHTDPPRRRCWMAQREREIVGHIQLSFDWRNGNATIGRVAIAPDMRGRRLARPMIQLVLSEAFALRDIERVELNVYSGNAPAIATYARLGFVSEGTRRASTRVGTQRWDTMMMSLLRAEFPLCERCPAPGPGPRSEPG